MNENKDPTLTSDLVLREERDPELVRTWCAWEVGFCGETLSWQLEVLDFVTNCCNHSIIQSESKIIIFTEISRTCKCSIYLGRNCVPPIKLNWILQMVTGDTTQNINLWLLILSLIVNIEARVHFVFYMLQNCWKDKWGFIT